MESAQHASIVNFIWGIADDVLRDVYVRGELTYDMRMPGGMPQKHTFTFRVKP